MIFLLKVLRGIGRSHLKVHKIMKLILTSDRGGPVCNSRINHKGHLIKSICAYKNEFVVWLSRMSIFRETDCCMLLLSLSEIIFPILVDNSPICIWGCQCFRPITESSIGICPIWYEVVQHSNTKLQLMQHWQSCFTWSRLIRPIHNTSHLDDLITEMYESRTYNLLNTSHVCGPGLRVSVSLNEWQKV